MFYENTKGAKILNFDLKRLTSTRCHSKGDYRRRGDFALFGKISEDSATRPATP